MGKTPAEETADLREATREAHEVLGDLRRAGKELRGLLAEVQGAAAKVFVERMEEQVAEGLADYQRSIKTAIDDATEAVDRRFETIASILLGEAKGTRRKGDPSITEIARQIAAQRPPDARPLPEDVNGHALGGWHTHEDGRHCGYHFRLRLWVMDDGVHECTREHPEMG